MCLIFLSINNHPKYKLMVAANRDEFYDRKTSPAHWWKDHPFLLGGRDHEGGGTWLGITKQGRISMITNYRDLSQLKQQAPSRGLLVSNYLKGRETPEAYLKTVANLGSLYNGFNLIVGDMNRLLYYSNFQESIQVITPGIHGLSNHLLGTPWPKVRVGLDKINLLFNASEFDIEDVMSVMRDGTLAADEELPDTGIGLEKEKMLSSIFIKSLYYGTRSTTVIMIDYENNLSFRERGYMPMSEEFEEREYQFKLG